MSPEAVGASGVSAADRPAAICVGELGFHTERAEKCRVGPDSEVGLVQPDLRHVAVLHAPQRDDDVAHLAVQEQAPRHVETTFDIHHALDRKLSRDGDAPRARRGAPCPRSSGGPGQTGCPSGRPRHGASHGAQRGGAEGRDHGSLHLVDANVEARDRELEIVAEAREETFATHQHVARGVGRTQADHRAVVLLTLRALRALSHRTPGRWRQIDGRSRRLDKLLAPRGRDALYPPCPTRATRRRSAMSPAYWERAEITLHGHRFSYRTAGNGPLVVLLHGRR
jgi:hypothetical protein